MRKAGRIPRKRGGYALILALLLLVLLAVLAMTWNRRSALQFRLAAGAPSATQRYFDLVSLIDQAVWKLTQDPCWRTDLSGEVEFRNGMAFVVTVTNCALPGYADAVTVSCCPSGSATGVRASFRYCIDTVAGIGNPGYLGDGADAALARLWGPTGLALDATGNVLVADSGNHCIRNVSPAGLISTVAGTGAAGYAGNGGAARSAMLNAPQGVAADESGDVFIADTGNHWVRKVDGVTGVISLFQGAVATNGAPLSGSLDPALNGPSGVFAVSRPSPAVYIADTGNHRIVSVTSGGGMTIVAGTGVAGYSGDGGLAVSARLTSPRGVFRTEAGELYIADSGNHRVRRVDAAGIITTAAGRGIAGFSGDGGLATLARLDDPRAVFVDAAGNLFVVDAERNVLRVVSHVDGIIRTLAGPGKGYWDPDGTPAIQTRLYSPCGIVMPPDRGGRAIYISNRDNHQVRVLRWDVEPALY